MSLHIYPMISLYPIESLDLSRRYLSLSLLIMTGAQTITNIAELIGYFLVSEVGQQSAEIELQMMDSLFAWCRGLIGRSKSLQKFYLSQAPSSSVQKMKQCFTPFFVISYLFVCQVAKESLTNNNTPSCQCVICLHGFTEGDVFTKTPCYHYFHSLCLARYLKHAQERVNGITSREG